MNDATKEYGKVTAEQFKALIDKLPEIRKQDRYAKFATEHLTVAAARIENHPVGTGGNDGGNVVQFPTFFLRSARTKTAPIAGGRLNTGGL